MKKSVFTLKLDTELVKKVSTYYIYRSEEYEGNRPVVDGVYIQRHALGSEPPATISLVLEWDERR
jgi:hypothetical protein